MKTATSLTLGVLMGAGAIVPAASARIVVGQGIAGVQIGARSADVRDALGKPDRVVPPSWVYAAPLEGRVGFGHRRRVNFVWTTSTRQRTSKGIGPGASVAHVKEAYPKARCSGSDHQRTAICTLRTRTRTRVVETDFLFKEVVSRVDVFLVPPVAAPRPS